MIRAAFPDIHETIEDMLAEGDRVVTRSTWRGTHQGAFLGIAPTGKQVSVTGIDISRVASGKFVEHWQAADNLGLLQQLGVIPVPGQAS
jgi:predicted ester cyclase